MRNVFACLTICLLCAATALAEPACQVIRGTRQVGAPAETVASVVAAKDDLAAGLIPVIEAPGLNPKHHDTVFWTDGNTYDGIAMLADGPIKSRTGTSTTVTFALPKPSDIGAICVYSCWGDAHALQDYDVEVSSDASCVFRPLIRNVKVGRDGDAVAKLADTQQHFSITLIGDDKKQMLARGVRQVRFVFWNAGAQIGGRSFFVSRDRAHWGSAISEIDILTTPLSLVDVDSDTGGETP